jgi:hypothetical protein
MLRRILKREIRIGKESQDPRLLKQLEEINNKLEELDSGL